jgi:hypothetical protein
MWDQDLIPVWLLLPETTKSDIPAPAGRANEARAPIRQGEVGSVSRDQNRDIRADLPAALVTVHDQGEMRPQG